MRFNNIMKGASIGRKKKRFNDTILGYFNVKRLGSKRDGERVVNNVGEKLGKCVCFLS